MAEWTIAPALKAGVGKLTEGSNPSASVRVVAEQYVSGGGTTVNQHREHRLLNPDEAT